MGSMGPIYRAAMKRRRESKANRIRQQTRESIEAGRDGVRMADGPFVARNASSSHVIVDLEGMDGYEFEDLCARIFQKAGWGDIELVGGRADGGRDIIITQQDGTKIVAECKHYMKSTVGRPILQKLHSAVISTHAQKGMVINTGKYSREAVGHARALTQMGHPIEIYDLQRFSEVADAAGVRFGKGAPILTYPLRDAAWLAGDILNRIPIESRPKAAADALSADIESVEMRPCWLARADIRQEFSASVGTIHAINEIGAAYLFDDADASVLGRYRGEPLYELPADAGGAAPTGRFGHGIREMRDSMTDRLVGLYTETVRYAAGNGRIYEKRCAPARKSVKLNYVQKACLPAYTVVFRSRDRRYRVKALTSGAGIDILEDGLRVCGICGEAAPEAMLCSDCGNVTHSGRRHGFSCRACGKTVCRACVRFERRMLVLRRHFCHSCMPGGRPYD